MAQQRARWATSKFSGLHSWATHGASRVPRGSEWSLSTYGPSYKDATDAQRATRIYTGFTGRGMYRAPKGARSFRGKGLYTGRGGYLSDLYSRYAGRAGSAIKAGLSAAGYGGAASMLTRAENIGRSMGMGSYTTPVVNEIVNAGGEGVVPTFKPTGDGNGVTISHKEYISDIFGPANAGGFQNTPYSINPGLERTFPWLSQVAMNYEEFTIKQLIFTFRSTVTDFVANNGQVGTVIMATQYNPSDAPFASKQDAMEYDMAMSGKTSQNMLHGVECDPRQLSGAVGKFTRAGPVSHQQDLKQYDHGTLNMCISNIPAAFANQALGELWVSYTIELRKPKFFVTRGLGILRDTFVSKSAGATLDVLGASALAGNQNRIGGQLSQPAANQIAYTFPATFSGSVRFTVIGAPGGAGEYIIPLIVPGGATTEIGDIFVGSPGSWKPSALSASSGAGANCVTIYDVNVRTPASAGAGLDNVLLFESNAPGVTYTALHIDVALINTGFNYTVGGEIMLDNQTTGELEPFP